MIGLPLPPPPPLKKQEMNDYICNLSDSPSFFLLALAPNKPQSQSTKKPPNQRAQTNKQNATFTTVSCVEICFFDCALRFSVSRSQASFTTLSVLRTVCSLSPPRPSNLSRITARAVCFPPRRATRLAILTVRPVPFTFLQLRGNAAHPAFAPPSARSSSSHRSRKC